MTGLHGVSQDVPEFRYIGGDPSLDFVNTADWAGGAIIGETLTDYAALVRWAAQGGIIDERVARSLASRARREEKPAQLALARARFARGVLRDAFLAVADYHGDVARAKRSGSDAIDALNELMQKVLPHMQLVPEDGKLALGWRAMSERLDSIVWPLTWSAVKLLASDDAARVRVCAGTNCGWMYVDRSRNGLRRWCRMDGCGARAKARRHYARMKGAAPVAARSNNASR